VIEITNAKLKIQFILDSSDTEYWIIEVWSYEFKMPKVIRGRIPISTFNFTLHTQHLFALCLMPCSSITYD
jgi:hypothetical protein